jgi:hypothetical protein
MREIVADLTMNAVLKILITSPGISRYFKNILRIEDKIWIPRDAAAEGRLLVGSNLAQGMS